MRQIAAQVRLHEQVRRRARVPVGDRGAGLGGIGRIEPRPVQRTRARAAPGIRADPNVDARSEIRLERRAGGLRHADDGDRDVRSVAGHSGRQGGGHVVGDDEGDGSGRLSVGRLLDEEAVAAVHERNVPVDRGRVRVRGTAVGRGRSDRVGGVDRLDELSAHRDLADVGTERRGPEVEISGDRCGGLHREHGQRAQHAGRLRADGGPVPEDVARVHVRCGALGRRHVGPVFADRLVEDHGLEDVGLIEKFGARRVVDQGQESKTVAELVEEDGDEIEAVAVLGVEAVVPGPSSRGSRSARRWS